MKRIKRFLKFLKWIEEQRIKAAIYSGSSGTLL